MLEILDFVCWIFVSGSFDLLIVIDQIIDGSSILLISHI